MRERKGASNQVLQTRRFHRILTLAGPSVPVALRIEPFQTTGLLRQDRIVYRPSPVEVGFYEYHRWAERPNDTGYLGAGVTQLTGRAGAFSKSG